MKHLKEKVGLPMHDITGSIVLHSTINQCSWAITGLSSKGQDRFEHIPQNTRKLQWSAKNHKRNCDNAEIHQQQKFQETPSASKMFQVTLLSEDPWG